MNVKYKYIKVLIYEFVFFVGGPLGTILEINISLFFLLQKELYFGICFVIL